MKAILKKEAAPGVVMEEVPIPEYREDEVLIKIRKSSICGTDVHIYKWDAWARRVMQVPTIIGHEFVGEIVEIGKLVNGFHVGQRVSVEGHLTCGFCESCRSGLRHLCVNTLGIGVQRNGGFAEYVNVPAENLFAIPDSISDSVASILDPLGNAAHTALSFDLVGADVLITGAGPIGVMAAAIAQHVGARKIVVTDINDYRLGLAKELGATHCVNILQEELESFLKEIDMEKGFQVGLEMSGNHDGLRSVIKSMYPGGKIGLLGIFPQDVAIDWGEVIFKGLTLKGIYGREIFNTWFQVARMLESGLDVDPVITHEFSAEDYQEAFDTMTEGKCGKIVLNWQS